MDTEVKMLRKLESEVLEIKSMLKRIETMLIEEEEVSDEEKKEIEKRLKEAKAGETVSLEELMD